MTYPHSNPSYWGLTIDGHTSAETSEVFDSLADQTDKLLLISNLEFNFRLQHFKNICTNMGKPLDIWMVNKYNQYSKKSIILRFNTVAEKRHFMHVFRNVLPDY